MVNGSNVFNSLNITSIPEDLFKYNTKLETLIYSFTYTNITSIPENLFENCTSLISLRNCFSSTDITSIPENLFINNTGITSFESTFAICTSLTGSSPKLWDNTIWSNVTVFTNCFIYTGTLGASGANIPTSWGGSCDCSNDCATLCSGD
jgi:hypothetical protein